jgi:prevent-host-death family protein
LRTITATEFKAKCLKLMDEVDRTGEPLMVTKNGVPVARILPATARRSIVGNPTGRMKILGDIISPATDPDEWEALR